MRYRLMPWMAAVVVFASFVSGSARAEFRPRVDVGSSGAVVINGRVALRFRASNGSLSAVERAQITAQRLTNLVAAGLDPAAVYLKAEKWQARIYAGETMVCIVTAADARAGKTTTAGLGSTWVRSIRELLSLPAVTLSDREIVVPLGENRRVQVGGAATGPISATSASGSVAVASPGADGRYVQVTGQSVGQATVEVAVDGERVTMDVWVKKYAGAVPKTIDADVTGSPCPKHLLEYAVKQAVLRGVVLEQGAQMKVGSIRGVAQSLQSGLAREATVDVTISGEGYITYGGQASVRVHNTGAQRDEVGELFYSNNPEKLLKFQTLFAGRIEPNKATRILYHHQNAIGKRAKLLVEVINPNVASAAFHVTRGVANPMIDTVLVGYVAGNAFMRDMHVGASVTERVPGQSRLVLVADMLGNMETSSGVIQVKEIEGQGAYIRVAAVPPDTDDAQVGAITPTPAAVAMELSDQVYPNPVKVMETGYVVGEHWAFISIGKHAITDSSAQKKLFGNYGVTYDIKVKLENPTGQAKKVSVLFEPSAGLASGVFIINGEFVSAKYAKPPLEVTLVSYRLAPGETRNVRIMTMPMSGSNYPATLVVRS